MMYFLLGFSTLVLIAWYSMAGWMIYQIGKDMGLWVYVTKWIKWRYGW